MLDGRGWSPGFGRFVGDELRWYRMFSFASGPSGCSPAKGWPWSAGGCPKGRNGSSMPADWVILRCTSHHAPVEIAMARSTVDRFPLLARGRPSGGGLAAYCLPGLAGCLTVAL